MEQYIYLFCTNDKYEFPVAVADSVKELAEMIGTSISAVRSGLYRDKITGRSQYKKVLLSEED